MGPLSRKFHSESTAHIVLCGLVRYQSRFARVPLPEESFHFPHDRGSR